MHFRAVPRPLEPERPALAPLDEQAYGEFAKRVIADGWLPDPWIDGVPRFDPQPLSLPAARVAKLTRAAEDVAAACDELCKLCARRPHLIDALGMTPWQRAMWLASAPHWHGLARADVFEVAASGIQVCELNSDTPSGMAEAIVLGRLLAGERDANRHLLSRWVNLVQQVAPPVPQHQRPPTAGLLWPTEQGEDLPMLLMWQHALELAGWRVVRGSPFNLSLAADGRAALFGDACDVLVRHYKTDWWGERLPVWRDEVSLPDTAPLAQQLAVLMEAGWAGKTVTLNPLGAALPQNKRFYALLWQVLRDHPGELSLEACAAIRKHVPPTWRLEDLPAAQLVEEQAQWVLKSDYGCEGDEVVLGCQVSATIWAQALAQAVPGRWVAQQRFDAALDPQGAQVNFGVYLIGGQAAGLLARRSPGATDRMARMAAVAIERE